ncbi:MAG TPA: alginate lyase family protein [Longimicrobium sp.]|nr:alginate lyase family protein [Longimicrobium sp.]
MRGARLLAHSVAHTRPRQLLARAGLLAKRRLLQRAAAAVPALRESVRAGRPPPLAPAPPPPVFAPRHHLVRGEGAGLRLAVLGWEWPLAVPVRWHPPELERGTRLEKLNLHYMEYLEGVDDAAFAALVEDWIDHNPPFRPGYWLDSWNSYALSIRCVVWMQQLAARGDRVPAGTAGRAASSLAAQVRFLVRNLERDIGGNHLVKNLKALLWAGRFFQGPEAARWRVRGERLLARELDEQVLPDGVHYERSPAYHAQVLADLLECRRVMEPGPLRERLDAVLARMAQAMADLTHPDGAVSLFNDGGLRMTYAPGECLEAYAGQTGRRVHPRRVFALEAAGYYGARDGATLVVADCGAVGPDHLPAHAHGDVLAFEWSVDGVRLVVDAGVYEYHPGEARDYSRSTRAHNTVTVGDADQCEFYGAFRVARRARATVHRYAARGDGFVLEGSHDGFRRLPGAPVHARRFDASPRRVEVADRVRGGAGQPVAARLLLHPDCEVTPTAAGALLRCGPVAAELRTDAPVSVQAARWFPDFGVSLPTRQLVLDYGAAPCEGGFVLHAPEAGSFAPAARGSGGG